MVDPWWWMDMMDTSVSIRLVMQSTQCKLAASSGRWSRPPPCALRLDPSASIPAFHGLHSLQTKGSDKLRFSVVLSWSRDRWQTDVLERSQQSRPDGLFGGNWFLELEETTIWYGDTYSSVVLVSEISVTRARDESVSLFVGNKLGRPNNTISF